MSHCDRRGRKWTQWSAQLDVTDLLTLTTGVWHGRDSFVSNTNNSNTLKFQNNAPASSQQLHFHSTTFRSATCLVAQSSASVTFLSSTAADSSSYCSLVDACWFSGISGLFFRLLVSSLEITTLKHCVVSVWVSVCLHFFLSECVHLCVFDACVCGSALILYGQTVAAMPSRTGALALWIQLQKARIK